MTAKAGTSIKLKELKNKVNHWKNKDKQSNPMKKTNEQKKN
jgi:hypothetical protein